VLTILGDLSSSVFSNPWHEFWLQMNPMNPAHRRLCVKDLVTTDNGEWNSQKLISVLGFRMALYVAVKFRNHLCFTGVPDRLVFTKASHGCYTVKIGYLMLRYMKRQGSNQNNGLLLFFKTLWKQNNIIPRIQFFLWRIAQEGLPVGASWA
jgi:hypothetical protein